MSNVFNTIAIYYFVLENKHQAHVRFVGVKSFKYIRHSNNQKIFLKPNISNVIFLMATLGCFQVENLFIAQIELGESLSMSSMDTRISFCYFTSILGQAL